MERVQKRLIYLCVGNNSFSLISKGELAAIDELNK